MARFQIVQGEAIVRWVAGQTNEFGSFGAATGIGLLKDLRIEAGVVFNEYNGVNINMHVACVPHAFWTRDFLWAIFDYAFNTARVKRVTGLIGEGNARSRAFAEKIGGTLEARLAHAHPTGDLLIYRLTRPECRWLSVRHSECKGNSDHEIRLAA